MYAYTEWMWQVKAKAISCNNINRGSPFSINGCKHKFRCHLRSVWTDLYDVKKVCKLDN